ncbi:MAG: TIGR02646 family protein [Bacteroidales bacterium]|nr:TIGR02646 family protein [Bacteroidales bacterium]
MRYICKTEACHDFEDFIRKNELDKYLEDYIIDDTLSEQAWHKFEKIIGATGIKKKLRSHFHKEQKGLCVYCEQILSIHHLNKVLSDISHIEHIKPKSRRKFPQETFKQGNLGLSCNGFDISNKTKKSEFCGHNKNEKYDESLFLHPFEIKNIEQYFIYTQEGKIMPNANLDKLERRKAQYMIDILKLNNLILINMRKEVYFQFIEIFEQNNENLYELLDEDADMYPSFFTMLKQFFSQI